MVGEGVFGIEPSPSPLVNGNRVDMKGDRRRALEKKAKLELLELLREPIEPKGKVRAPRKRVSAKLSRDENRDAKMTKRPAPPGIDVSSYRARQRLSAAAARFLKQHEGK